MDTNMNYLQTRRMGTIPTATPAHQDAAEIEQNLLYYVVGGLIVGSVFLVLLNDPLAVRFLRSPGGKQPALLGLLLVFLSVGVLNIHHTSRLRPSLLVAGLSSLTYLAVTWLQSSLVPILWIIPATCAVFLLDKRLSLGFCVGIIILAWSVSLSAAPSLADSHELAYLVGLPIALLWGIKQMERRLLAGVLSSYRVYFEETQQRLEETRDDRLQVRQLNEDLANAYAQLRRLNEMLRASKIEAEQARQVKEDFVAKVSHELRTPLNMIIGFSEIMVSAPETYADHIPSALLSDIDVIHRNSRHLLQLINDVLILSQADAGQLTLLRSWVNLTDILDEAVRAVTPLYKTKKLKLDLALPSTPLPVFCDSLRVRQVLLNLLSNAGRYTPAGRVEVSIQEADRQMLVAVRDTGPGIKAEEQKRIFEPFHQIGELTKRVNGGSGLGLSISKQLIEAHGGKMWVESTLGNGSTFYFSLPQGEPLEPSYSTVSPVNPYSRFAGEPRRALTSLPSPKDQIVVLSRRETLSQQLAGLLPDLDVMAVPTIHALSGACSPTPPSAVVINDVDAMNDKTFSHRLTGLPQRTPILSFYLPGKEEACKTFNVMDYLTKPVTREALLAAAKHIVAPQSTVLCVEDDITMARLMRRQLSLSENKLHVIHCQDGATALELMRQHKPDLVFLDLTLPDQDGYEMLRRKNADAVIRDIPVVIVSARDPHDGPVVTSRLRVELVGGLSIHDIAATVQSVSQALSPSRR